jgi:hypothetical protein
MYALEERLNARARHTCCASASDDCGVIVAIDVLEFTEFRRRHGKVFSLSDVCALEDDVGAELAALVNLHVC